MRELELGTNRFMHLVACHTHPTVWKLVSRMLEVNRAKIAIQELGEGISKTKRRKFDNIVERLRNLCSRVANNEIYQWENV